VAQRSPRRQRNREQAGDKGVGGGADRGCAAQAGVEPTPVSADLEAQVERVEQNGVVENREEPRQPRARSPILQVVHRRQTLDGRRVVKDEQRLEGDGLAPKAGLLVVVLVAVRRAGIFRLVSPFLRAHRFQRTLDGVPNPLRQLLRGKGQREIVEIAAQLLRSILCLFPAGAALPARNVIGLRPGDTECGETRPAVPAPGLGALEIIAEGFAADGGDLFKNRIPGESLGRRIDCVSAIETRAYPLGVPPGLAQGL